MLFNRLLQNKLFLGGLGLVILALLWMGLVTIKQANQRTSISLPKEQPLLFQPTPTPTPTSVSILFGGDVMFDRHIRSNALQQGSYDFVFGPRLSELLDSTDFQVANLEGPITDFPSRSIGSEIGSTNNYIFTFDPQILETLAKNNWIFSLGNNHLLNFGEEGWLQTRNRLEQAGIGFFGYVSPGQTENRTFILEKNGIKIGLVNYDQFAVGGEDAVFADLATVRPLVDSVVVYTHWGNEYVPENAVTRQLAHKLIYNGADLIIGSHPHVVQGIEAYQGKQIYYSLGNFVFDQYFEEAVRNGLVVVAEFSKEKAIEFSEQTVELNISGQTELN